MTSDPKRRAIVIRGAEPEWARALELLLVELERSGDGRWFHPFPLDGASARRIAESEGADRFLIAVEQDRVLALGMLRGWDEGYDTPSLGIAVSPTSRGAGLGRRMMDALHALARERGAKRIRLTVDCANRAAMELYASMGYAFEPGENDRLIGYLEL